MTNTLEPGGFHAQSFLRDAAEEDEPWLESLKSDWQADDSPLADSPLADELAALNDFARHPLQRLASDLHLRIFDLFQVMDSKAHSSYLDTLVHGAGEIGGGLAQALSEYETDPGGLERGLAVVQLKRALRGAAFAVGALVGLRAESALNQTDCDDVRAMIRQLREGILAELARLRDEWPQ